MSDERTSSPAPEEDHNPAAEAAAKPTASKKRRWRRRLTVAGVASPLLLVGMWTAVHKLPWLGPMVANGLRSVVGVEAVSRLEDFAYGVQDRFNRSWRAGEAPKAYWQVPTRTEVLAELPVAEVAEGCKVPPFRPKDVGPMHTTFKADGDGQWVPVVDARHRDDAPRMYKTLLHPDKRRSWAAVTIVAIDTRQVKLHMMAGRYEPKSGTHAAWGYKRKAMIPTEHQGALIAAFNGGFRSEHGNYGMKIDGVTLIKPRRLSCMIAMMPGETLLVGDYDQMKDKEPKALWWRQTPACMVEDNELHAGLRSENNTYWGATIDGETVIRRSALGVSADGKTMFNGIGDHTTARALAVAMRHAGAVNVAQLDVNWSYPKFVLYEPVEAGSKELKATKLAEGFEFTEDEYVRRIAHRDFFYLTRRSDDRIAKRVCGDADPGPAHTVPAEGEEPAEVDSAEEAKAVAPRGSRDG